jgi:hypothetical protein
VYIYLREEEEEEEEPQEQDRSFLQVPQSDENDESIPIR